MTISIKSVGGGMFVSFCCNGEKNFLGVFIRIKCAHHKNFKEEGVMCLLGNGNEQIIRFHDDLTRYVSALFLGLVHSKWGETCYSNNEGLSNDNYNEALVILKSKREVWNIWICLCEKMKTSQESFKEGYFMSVEEIKNQVWQWLDLYNKILIESGVESWGHFCSIEIDGAETFFREFTGQLLDEVDDAISLNTSLKMKQSVDTFIPFRQWIYDLNWRSTNLNQPSDDVELERFLVLLELYDEVFGGIDIY